MSSSTQLRVAKILLVVSSFLVYISIFRDLRVSTLVDYIQLVDVPVVSETDRVLYPATEIRPVPIPGPHPFQGAFDSDGNRSIVHDPYALHKRKRHRNTNEEDLLDCHVQPGRGPEGELGYRFLKDRLQIIKQQYPSNTGKNKYRVLCAVYTYEGNANQILAVADTWGARCDGFVAASTATDLALAKVRLHHRGTLGTYSSIWQKVRSLLAYLYTNFLDEFDFVFLSGDDTYLVVENLKAWLASASVVEATKEHSEPLYAGLWTRPFWRKGLPDDFVYHGGGSGYTLNRAAWKLFVEQGLNHSGCKPDIDKSEEDLFMGMCMRALGVPPVLAREDGAFLQYPIEPKGVIDVNTKPYRVKEFWMKQLQWYKASQNMSTISHGLDALSNVTFSFHEIKTSSYMRRVDAIVYRSIENDCNELDGLQNSTKSRNNIGASLH